MIVQSSLSNSLFCVANGAIHQPVANQVDNSQGYSLLCDEQVYEKLLPRSLSTGASGTTGGANIREIFRGQLQVTKSIQTSAGSNGTKNAAVGCQGEVHEKS